MEGKKQRSFLRQVQIGNRIENKNPGSKITFEFGPNFLGVQTRLKNLTNFPNLLFDLTFWIVHLDWHGCMEKTRVSKQDPYDLV
jgi:hypothetical protein